MYNKKNIRLGVSVVCTLCTALIIGGVIRSEKAQQTKQAFFEPEYMQMSEKASIIASMLEKNYIEDFDDTELSEKMYAAMTDAMDDPYTCYLTKEQMTAFTDDSSGRMSGIGVVIAEEDGHCVIKEVLEDSPAEKAGIKAGDIITEIDGTDISGMPITEISAMTKGVENTNVNISVMRGTKRLDFNVERKSIELKYVTGKCDGNIGYIKITEFSQVAAEQFKTMLADLEKQNIKGLIIDLRNNPGGIIDVVAEIADTILPEGLITYTVDKYGNRRDILSAEGELDMPVAVLVNGGSASASELLAGALQDRKKGIIIGTQTFGKGIVQGLYSLSDGSGLKITIQKYYTPNGVCINGIGITPDYVIENDGNEDLQYNKAMELLKTKD